MRVHIRGTRASGDRIEADDDLPETIRVGDSFAFGLQGEERVAVIGMHKDIRPGGDACTTVVVAPAFAPPAE